MCITSFVELLLTKEDLAKQNTLAVTNQFISINGIMPNNGQWQRLLDLSSFLLKMS
jgi:hypothetical protein